jgi:hypothetical protein
MIFDYLTITAVVIATAVIAAVVSIVCSKH